MPAKHGLGSDGALEFPMNAESAATAPMRRSTTAQLTPWPAPLGRVLTLAHILAHPLALGQRLVLAVGLLRTFRKIVIRWAAPLAGPLRSGRCRLALTRLAASLAVGAWSGLVTAPPPPPRIGCSRWIRTSIASLSGGVLRKQSR